MARISFFLTIHVLLQEPWLSCGAAVLLPRRSADTVLRRQRRYNSGIFEELWKDNLKRECLEETCSLEEAREVFEDNEKTMEFWKVYADGDQCQSSPCQNSATCKDGEGYSYTCLCPRGFTGVNCEIEVDRLFSLNNRNCMHFSVDGAQGMECDCAFGYKLAADRRTCEPQADVPCGTRGKRIMALMSRRSGLSVDYPFSTLNATKATVNLTTPTVYTTYPPHTSKPTLSHSRSKLPLWVFGPTLPPTSPTINESEAFGKRIVGGHKVVPGEIPWQVALVNRLTKQVFCGGSILSEWWVITAAHCLAEGKEDSFFIRAGEHNLDKPEGTEQDHDVSKQHLHPNYNAQRNPYNNDVALLQLQTPLRLTDFARPICLGPGGFTETLLRTDALATVSGWGRTRYQGAESRTLLKVELPIVDRTQCLDSSSDRISRYMFCAGYSDGLRDACQGDSGGPHASLHRYTWFLTGIVSWGEECAKEGKYGVYTRVSQYYKWIAQVTGFRS